MISGVFTAFLFSLMAVVQAGKGIDVSALTSTASFSCLKNQGYSRAILRAYMEAWGNNPGGKVDPNLIQNYKNAKAAGIPVVDLYMFPCTGRSTCKSPATQVSEFITVMNANKMLIGTIWLDVEVDSQANNWPSPTSNKQTLTAFKNAWNGSGLNWGVYSSLSQWSSITGGSSWVLDASKPLWYAHYDNTANFNDFRAFGGWSSPKMKQYAGDVSVCSAGVDVNYFA
ncbi:glycoside hydrolase superfamily [Chlamydoabsidia padenii]|nr:glycoside hydrolase superfamily [Chlamydoabsidia padenii]